MSYYCKKCKKVYDELDMRMGSGMWRGIPSLACPKHHEDVVEAGKCEMCGKAIDPDEQFCEDCKQDMHSAWTTAVAQIVKWNKKDMKEYKTVEELFLDYLEREVM